MPQHNPHRSTASSPDFDHFRRLYAHTWKPGCERVRWVTSILEARGIRFEVDGFMADSDQWASERPAERHVPDIRILAS
ncbi:MAG TPA: hypothetical protein V6D00_09735 [Pantanalinema sp.]